MTTPKYGLQFNRRGNLRVRVDKKSEIYFHENMSHDILIKDISENGIGFYISEDVLLEIGERCMVVLEEMNDIDESIRWRIKDNPEIEVEVVRIAVAPGGLKMCGCVILS